MSVIVIIQCENKQCLSIDRTAIDLFEDSLLYVTCKFYEKSNHYRESTKIHLEFPEINIQTLEIILNQNPIFHVPQSLGIDRFLKDLDFLNIRLYHPFLKRWLHIYFPGEQNQEMKIININTRLALNILSNNCWLYPVNTFISLLMTCMEIGNSASCGFRNLNIYMLPNSKLRENELALIESKKGYLYRYIPKKYGIRFKMFWSKPQMSRDVCTSMDITYTDKLAILYHDLNDFTYKHEQNLLKFQIGHEDVRFSCQVTTLTCLYIVLSKNMLYWTYQTQAQLSQTQSGESLFSYYYISYDIIIVMENGYTFTLNGEILRGVGNTYLTYKDSGIGIDEKNIKSATLVLYMLKNPKLILYNMNMNMNMNLKSKNMKSIHLSW
jgi:hypothetical protein